MPTRPWKFAIALVALASSIILGGAAPAIADVPFDATIAGHVYLGDPSTSAVSGEVSVQYWLSSNGPSGESFGHSVMTDASGNYTIPGLYPTGYFLKFTYLGTRGFSGTSLTNPLGASAEAGAVVVAGGATLRQDMTLPHLAAITGKVTLGDSSTVAPVGSVSVSYEKYRTTGAWDRESSPVAVAAGGRYTLPALGWGEYRLHFTYKSTSGYQSKWYPDGESDNLGVPIQFDAGTDMVLDFTMPATRVVTGHVSLGTSATSAGTGQIAISYYYYPDNWTGFHQMIPAGVSTDVAGNFTVTNLIDGWYGFTFSVPGDSNYQTFSSNQFHVGAVSAAPVNATLIHMVAATGHVNLNDSSNSHPASAPARSVIVFPYPVPGTIGALFGNGTGVYVDANGNYSLPQLVDHTTYTLRFHYDGTTGDYADFYLGGSSNLSDAEYFDTAGSAVAVSAVTMKYADEISGVVTDSHNAPLAGIHVTGQAARATYAVTDSAGRFTLKSLVPGSYELDFYDPSHTFVKQVWDGNSEYYMPTLVPISGGGIHSGFDMVMPHPVSISGAVTGVTPEALAAGDVYVDVEVYDSQSDTWVDTGDSYDVDSSGHYSISGLSPDYYKIDVIFDDGSFTTDSLSDVLDVATEGATAVFDAALITALPVYRFWNPQSNDHFYTMNKAERDHIIASYSTSVWRYEGVAFDAFPTQRAGTVPLYRFWSPRLQGHFFTANGTEKDQIIRTYAASTWSYEGVAFYVYPDNTTAANTVEVARFWSGTTQQHFYTTDPVETAGIIRDYPIRVWSFEGYNFRVPSY
ncbi:MAG: hypothetical protein JWO18_1393 [Microbacteriaceae bacterium]|nr:hypothetical protein [Microbacteriaceae bacterium]